MGHFFNYAEILYSIVSLVSRGNMAPFGVFMEIPHKNIPILQDISVEFVRNV